MPDLMLRDLPPKMMREAEEWAALRQTTPEAAAKELLRIALHVTADRHQPPRAARANTKANPVDRRRANSAATTNAAIGVSSTR